MVSQVYKLHRLARCAGEQNLVDVVGVQYLDDRRHADARAETVLEFLYHIERGARIESYLHHHLVGA